LGDDFVAPETEVERALAAIWSEVLGVERVGVHDRFFELGGNSLQAGRMLLRVRDLFGVDVPVERLFRNPTIHGLTVAIAEELMAQAEPVSA
jgi:acyl carrier protein